MTRTRALTLLARIVPLLPIVRNSSTIVLLPTTLLPLLLWYILLRRELVDIREPGGIHDSIRRHTSPMRHHTTTEINNSDSH